MLIADMDTWQQGCVEVERKLARKAGNNARGAIGRDVFSVLHYSKTHYICLNPEYNAVTALRCW
jgi:hypothetical protein